MDFKASNDTSLVNFISATLKLKKVNLQKESYHFKTFTDEVYFLDNSAKTYRRLDESVYRQIEQGLWQF